MGKQLDAASLYAFNFLLKYSRDLYKPFINIIEMFVEKWEHLLIRTHSVIKLTKKLRIISLLN